MKAFVSGLLSRIVFGFAGCGGSAETITFMKRGQRRRNMIEEAAGFIVGDDKRGFRKNIRMIHERFGQFGANVFAFRRFMLGMLRKLGGSDNPRNLGKAARGEVLAEGGD